jgi:hypothetical protein
MNASFYLTSPEKGMNATMNQKTASQNKNTPAQVRTVQLPAQEGLTLDPQQAPLLSAEQVYAQRQLENLPDGSLSTPTFVP